MNTMTEQDSHSLDHELPECPPDLGMGSTDVTKNGLLPTLDFPADPELVVGGWERRFMADPTRAEEATSIYKELGFEVLTVAIEPSELSVLCGDCRLATCQAYVTLYTRRTPP